jgi:spermidine synthase
LSKPLDSSGDPDTRDGLPVGRGRVSGDWYYEENPGASRLGIRVCEKVHEERSAYQTLAVYETAFFGRVLTLDDVVMLTERDEFVYHEMLVHVPLCSMPEPQRVLIIGGGDCGALREALKHPSVEKVVQCDIDERVTRVSEDFFPWVREACADPRAELVFADGIDYVARHAASFDLVVVDSTDPVGPAAGLFVRDFYTAVIGALRRGGVMTAQTESPHWNADLVAAIYREIRASFRHGAAYACWMPTYPSGCWTLAYASPDRRHDEFFDERRAFEIETRCRYYNRALQQGAFALPTFARDVVDRGVDPFERFTAARRGLLARGGEPKE